MRQHQDRDRHEDVERHRVAEPHDLPVRRHQTQRAVREADVPVGLGTGGDRGGVVRAVVPDRVDREQRRDEGEDAGDDEEEATGLRGERREDRDADDVLVGLARAGELRVLVDDDEHEVDTEHGDEDRRQQQDVQRVQAADDVGPGELAAEQEVRDPDADHRDALDHADDDPQAVAGEQVVGERVAREALGHGEDPEDEAEDPVELTRLAERTREEHAGHVQHDRGHEQQGRPVVDLPDEEPAADVERDVSVDCRAVDISTPLSGTYEPL